MRIVAFSDWRVQPFDMIEEVIRTHRPDVVLYAGDDLRRFDNGSPFNNTLQELEIQFYYVNGNDDVIGSLRWPRKVFSSIKKKISMVTGSASTTDGIPKNPSFGEFSISTGSEIITVFGVECTFGLHSEVKNEPKRYVDILLSHLPPLGKLDLSVRFGMDHIGSKRLLDAVKKYQPRVVICGHSHIWGGFASRIGQTQIVNVASPDRDRSYGHYALIDTKDWSVEVRRIEEKGFRKIRGLGTIKKQLREKLDLKKTWELLAPLYSPNSSDELLATLRHIERYGVDTSRYRVRVESLRWDKPKVVRRITFNPDEHSFVDVETGLAQGQEPGGLWLIGLLHQGEMRQFLIPEDKKEFRNYMRKNRITSLVSWTRYDMKALRPLLQEAGLEVDFIDACQRTSNCVQWHTYRLHEIYDDLLGKSGPKDLIPGHIAGLCADHLIIPKKSCPHCPPREEIIERIRERNEVDIFQMVEICKKLWSG